MGRNCQHALLFLKVLAAEDSLTPPPTGALAPKPADENQHLDRSDSSGHTPPRPGLTEPPNPSTLPLTASPKFPAPHTPTSFRRHIVTTGQLAQAQHGDIAGAEISTRRERDARRSRSARIAINPTITQHQFDRRTRFGCRRGSMGCTQIRSQAIYTARPRPPRGFPSTISQTVTGSSVWRSSDYGTPPGRSSSRSSTTAPRYGESFSLPMRLSTSIPGIGGQ